MDAWCIAALVVGIGGLLGGFLWGWGATRTASRVAFKIVGAANDAKPDLRLEARVTALENWKARIETDGLGHQDTTAHG
ncbi:MAG: hypothetical protein OXH86_00685 [Acidimicrobiaceae bacterium]|nr:hypothetical protein [Acidimicrobiaceae bacterium]MDE0495844.1 hypothetical protein [Acidimicrobiaceae bacterium]